MGKELTKKQKGGHKPPFVKNIVILKCLGSPKVIYLWTLWTSRNQYKLNAAYN